MNRRVTSRLLLTGALLAIAIATPLAGAQIEPEGELAIPGVRSDEMRDAPQILSYLMFAILLGIGVGVNMIPSKRGHQD